MLAPQRQNQGIVEGLADHAEHEPVVTDRVPKIAAHRVAQPHEILHIEWLVKTILVDDHLPELLRSIQRHNAVNGFSRHHLQQGEYNNRHTEEREERQAYSFQDNSDHTNSPCILRPAARFHWPQARVFCRK